jgi:hypothetical protein
MTSNVSELLPCPFCGHTEPVFVKVFTITYVTCRNSQCCAAGPNGETPEKAAAKWNALRRVAEIRPLNPDLINEIREWIDLQVNGSGGWKDFVLYEGVICDDYELCVAEFVVHCLGNVNNKGAAEILDTIVAHRIKMQPRTQQEPIPFTDPDAHFRE